MVSNGSTVANVTARGVKAAVLAAAVSLLLATRASAATSPTNPPSGNGSINAQIGSLRQQVSEASAEEADLLDKIDTTTAALNDAQAKVAGFDATIADT